MNEQFELDLEYTDPSSEEIKSFEENIVDEVISEIEKENVPSDKKKCSGFSKTWRKTDWSW